MGWKEKKKNTLSKKGKVVDSNTQSRCPKKNEVKQSHFGFINKILHNFQPVKFMIYFKLTIYEERNKKEKSAVFILGGKITENMLF